MQIRKEDPLDGMRLSPLRVLVFLLNVTVQRCAKYPTMLFEECKSLRMFNISSQIFSCTGP